MTTRRQFLGWGLRVVAGTVGLGAAGFAGHEWPSGAKHGSSPAAGTTPTPLSPGSPEDDLSEVYSFYTRPDLRPPRVRIVRGASSFKLGGAVSSHVLLSPKAFAGSGPGQAGFMILDRDGDLRWFLPASKPPFDMQCQRLKGKPVLTWWEGDVRNGSGTGDAVIADMSFREVARFGQVDGLSPDLHELNLTEDGTALMTAYHTVATDLSSVGGSRKGYVAAAVAMEVDVASGKLVHRWESLDHVAVSETYQEISGSSDEVPFNYFHMNSIAVAPDGDLLISARNTWAVYKVGRSSGQVKWRLNGKESDFTMGGGSHFSWQHHARPHSGERLSVFDNGDSPAEEPQSRALMLRVDEAAMTCALERSFVHPARLLVTNQGSVQLLADGTVFVGWGAQPYFSRFSPAGELLVDGRFPTNVQSYRALVAELSAAPSDRPAVVVGANPPGGSSVYVSWNGSTEVTAWRVLAGTREDQLTGVATAEWAGFETAVAISSTGPYFQVVALDSAGREIGHSEVVKA